MPTLLRSLEFAVDDAGIGARRMEKMAIEPPEVTGDAKVLHVGFDAVDGRRPGFDTRAWPVSSPRRLII